MRHYEGNQPLMDRLIGTIKDTWLSPVEVTVTSWKTKERQALPREVGMTEAGIDVQFTSSPVKLYCWSVEKEVGSPEPRKTSVEL